MTTKQVNRLIIISSVIVVSAAIIFVIFFEDTAISVISTIATLIGIIALLVEFKKGKDITQAEFLLYTNDYFTKMPSNNRLAALLNDYVSTKKNLLKKSDQSDLIDYLVFLESLAPSIIHNNISIKKIDNMLSYTFFRIMNNPFVQDLEIIPEAEYYRGCIKLHKLWTDYKKKNHLPILLDDTSLEKRFPDYEKYTKIK